MMRRMMSVVRRHAGAVVVFVLAGAWLLSPLVGHFTSAVPGAGAGDNLCFVWNVWWTRYALHHSGQTMFFTPLLLHPFGADLTLHTLTPLPALVVSAIDNPVLAQNLLIAGHVFLNFVCAYALAYRETRQRSAALVGAFAFGWSPFLLAHLQGHFNLVAAWVIPLTALVASAAKDRPSWKAGILLGFVLGCVAYVDYYYFIYTVGLAGILLLAGTVRPYKTVTPARRWRRALTRVFLAALILDALVVAWILLRGGSTVEIGSLRLSMRNLTNPVSAAWLLLLLWLLIQVVSTVRIRTDRVLLWRRLPTVAAAALIGLAVVLPLALRAFSLWRAGMYSSQRYLWRSAPSGIDLATLALGNPFNVVYGSAATRVYERLGVDLVEDVGWLGPSVVVLSIVALLRYRSRISAWIAAALIFGIWSLGPYIEIGGHGSTLWLPATLIRYLPILSNARMPARAIVVVYACCAVMSSYGFAHLVRRSPAGRSLAALLAICLFLDFLPQRPAVYQVGRRPIDTELARDGTPGAVLELPMGVRDGRGELGTFDSRVLYSQTFHERPILGGFVARIPSSIGQRYDSMEIVGPLLRLSSGRPLSAEHPDDDRTHARSTLEALNIRFVMVTLSTSPVDLLSYVDQVLPLRVVSRDENHVLYLVETSPADR